MTAMSICTVRGVNRNWLNRNDVTGKGSPTAVPVEFFESPSPDIGDARAIRHEVPDSLRRVPIAACRRTTCRP